MNLRLAKYDFGCQKGAARQRGIAFEITLEEWIAWWITNLGPAWQDKRGRAVGQYCMARKGDNGPYALWNIECILSTENTRYANSGENSAKSKISNKTALEIFKAEGTNSEIAKKFGVAQGVVNGIKCKKYYRKITADFPRKRRQRGVRGDRNPRTKIPEADIAFIRSSTESVKLIATRYGVSKGHIYDIKNNLKRRSGQPTKRIRLRLAALDA